MIGYVTLGSNDIERAKAFYDALCAEIGAKSFAPNDRIFMWATERGQPMLAVCKPYDDQPASVGNGTMVALAMGDQQEVDRFHAKAMELGAKNEGEPGPRAPGSGFYGGYFRDLDGNKLVAYCLQR